MIIAFKILIVLCTLFALSFVVVYSRAPWHRSAVGMLLMADGATITWILVVQTWQMFIHHVPIWVQFVNMVLLCVMLAWRTALAVIAQRDGRIERTEDEARRDH